MFTVMVSRFINNHFVGATTHEYDTLEQAAHFAAKIPEAFSVAIMDSEANILLPEMNAGALTQDKVFDYIEAAVC